ncbi:hypothetical protein FGO68_gene6370 [Halteria grandinella]|uniref:Uncharacterized protein n=1 Tax=Halteria grandinella TaxID=5974 RepID=A0A8J8SWP1_HALGN|nr:hypothetical protein FGO68_gene6370 [Halteria grandinella]
MQSGAQSQFAPKIAQNVLQNNPVSTATDNSLTNPNQKLGSYAAGASQCQSNQNSMKQEASCFSNVNGAQLLQGSHALMPGSQNGLGQTSSPQNLSCPQTGRSQSQLASSSQSAQQVMQAHQQNQSEFSQNPQLDASTGNFKNPLPKNPNSSQLQQAQNSIGLHGSIPSAGRVLNSGNSTPFSGSNSTLLQASTNSSHQNTYSAATPGTNSQVLQALLTQQGKLNSQCENRAGTPSSQVGLNNNGLHLFNGANSISNQGSTGSISGLNLASATSASQINSNNLQSLIDQQNKSQLLIQSNRQNTMVLPQSGANRQMMPSNYNLPNQPQLQHNMQMFVSSGSTPLSYGQPQVGYGQNNQTQNITNQQQALLKTLSASGNQSSLTQQMTESIMAAHQFAKSTNQQQQSAGSGSAASGGHYLNEKNGQSIAPAEGSSSSNIHIQQVQQQQQNQNSNTLTASPVLSTGGK